MQRRTADWVVKANSYVDTAFILRRDIKDCFKKTWADGQADIKAIAIHHYEIDPEHLEECAQASLLLAAWSTNLQRPLDSRRLLGEPKKLLLTCQVVSSERGLSGAEKCVLLWLVAGVRKRWCRRGRGHSRGG